MEGISARMRKGLNKYWGKKRRGYKRINGSDRRKTVKLGATTGARRRRWRIKIGPKVRIPKISSPKRLAVWVRDAYVRMMVSLANSMGGGDPMGGFGRAAGPPVKEYDDKMIIHMYKSMIMEQQGQFVPKHLASSKITASQQR